MRQAFELAREDAIESVVVGDRGERRCVDGERKPRPTRSLEHEPPGELSREVLRLGRAAAVAEKKYPAAAADRGHDRSDRSADGRLVVCIAPQIRAFGHAIRKALGLRRRAHVSIQNSSWCSDARSASFIQIFTTLPSYSETISFINFIASRMHKT